jgi:hypothetical protein
MLMAASLLFAPMVLTTSPDPTTPPSYNQVRAYVTGYNTTPEQTDDTPCTAASGADICGRRDVVACPRQIGFGTVVEIRGTTYTCEDRLARKFDSRFDISCDKDTACPPTVTGWATIRVYDRDPATASSNLEPHKAGSSHPWWPRATRAASSLWLRVAHTAGAGLMIASPTGPTVTNALRIVQRHAWNARGRPSHTWRG